jgi:hypothetical protein
MVVSTLGAADQLPCQSSTLQYLSIYGTTVYYLLPNMVAILIIVRRV